MCIVISSSVEAELGGLFENFQKATWIETALAEMGHTHPPTPVAINNYVTNSIYMIFYWLCDQVRQKYFHILWQ